jgi:hypothetical protein
MTVTYQDVDIDLVTVKISEPVFDAATVNNVFRFDTGSVNGSKTGPQQLQELDLRPLGSSVNRASLQITAHKTSMGGNNLVNVGFINAMGIDLESVTVQGGLGKIDAGDTDTKTPGLMSLTVESLGKFSTSTQAAGNDLNSVIQGGLSSLVVRSHIVGAPISVVMGASGDNTSQEPADEKEILSSDNSKRNQLEKPPIRERAEIVINLDLQPTTWVQNQEEARREVTRSNEVAQGSRVEIGAHFSKDITSASKRDCHKRLTNDGERIFPKVEPGLEFTTSLARRLSRSLSLRGYSTTVDQEGIPEDYPPGPQDLLSAPMALASIVLAFVASPPRAPDRNRTFGSPSRIQTSCHLVNTERITGVSLRWERLET